MKRTLAALLVAFSFSAVAGYSDGDRSGTIAKFTHKGALTKSWEGELATDNFSRKGERVTNTFKFSVRDPKLVAVIQQAMEAGKRVTLHYEQELIFNPLAQDSGYVVTGVK